jgi:hypothetical protein
MLPFVPEGNNVVTKASLLNLAGIVLVTFIGGCLGFYPFLFLQGFVGPLPDLSHLPLVLVVLAISGVGVILALKRCLQLPKNFEDLKWAEYPYWVGIPGGVFMAMYSWLLMALATYL